ncbi:dihydrodipicolinate reductase [haloarchaeon 3A1-DGR]|nr:dihydrodipicolinate reductase [haloarchaeon 3A1-DGR]
MIERDTPIRVVQCGIGAMGTEMLRLLTDDPGVTVVGAVDVDPETIGRDVGAITGGGDVGIEVADDLESVLEATEPDAVCLATADAAAEAMVADLLTCLRAGADVVSSNGGFFYPYRTHPVLARKVDRVARKNDASVLCTGLNPGFALDTLVVALTAVSESIDAIEASRTVDFSPYGAGVLEPGGFGLAPDEWTRRRDAGDLAGHESFPAQIRMIADGIGLDLDAVVQREFDPVVADEHRPVASEYPDIEAGEVAGFEQTYAGLVDGDPVVTLTLAAVVDPAASGLEGGDRIAIRGVPDTTVTTEAPFEPGPTTWATVVNALPNVSNADPGLKTMLDLPLPSASLGDMRKFLDPDR